MARQAGFTGWLASDDDLKHVRQRMVRVSDYLTGMLEEGFGLLGLNEPDVSHILKMYAFVDKSDILMSHKLKELNDLSQVDVYKMKIMYNDFRDMAFRVCYRSMV